jgi:hypothetical protein
MYINKNKVVLHIQYNKIKPVRGGGGGVRFP